MLEQLRQFFYRHRSIDRPTDHRVSAEANGMRSDTTLKPEPKPELQPELATQQFQLGHRAFDQGQFDEAIVHYRHALSADPTQTEIYQYLAEALSQVGDLAEAAACYRQAIDLTASSATELTQSPAERLQEQQLQSQTAIGVSDRTLHPHQIRLNPEQQPGDTQSDNGSVNCSLHGKGNSKGAIITHETELYLTQAENAYSQEKWQDTITYCRHLLQSQPNVSAYKLLGNALQRLGQFSEAVDAYLSAIQLAPQAADIYANLGSLYAQQQRWQDAVVYYQSAIAINPDFAGVYRNLAKVWAQLAQSDKAMECWYRAFTLEPEKVSAEEQINLGNWLLGQNRTEAAIDCYHQAIQLAPTLAAGYQNLAAALTRQGKTQEAAPFYCKAQELGLDIPAVPLSSQAAGATAIPSVSTNSKRMVEDRIAASHSFNGNGNGTHGSKSNGNSNGNGNGNGNGDRQHLSILSALTQPSRLGRAETQLAAAADYFEQEQWDEAIVASAEALQRLEPELVQTYRHLADAFYAKKQLTEAIRYARRVVELEPNSATDRVNLGSLYAQQEEWQAALDCYQTAIALDANLASAHWNLAKVWQAIDCPEQATNAFFQALTLEPSWASLSEHLMLAHTLRSQSQEDSALACYQQVIQRDATCAEAYAALAEMFAQQQQWQNSAIHYQQAIQHDPKNLNYLISFGQILAAVQQWQAAITVYRQVICLDPHPAHYLTLAQFLERQEQWDEAIECYQTLATLQPRWEVAHKLGDLLNRQQRWPEAVIAFRQAIDLNPDYSWSHNNLGDALIHLEQWQEAAAAFQRAIELHPDFHWSHYNLGEALAKLEQWDGAIVAYRRALELNLDIPYAHQKLGDVLQRRAKADLDTALQHYQQSINQNPHDIEPYHKALEIRPKDASLYLRFANTLLQQNQLDQAVLIYQMGLQLQPGNTDLLMNLQKLSLQIQAKNSLSEMNSTSISLSPCKGKQCITVTQDLDTFEEFVPEWKDYHLQGDELQLQGSLHEAIVCYEQAIAQNPLYSWSFHNLGDTYLKLQEWDQAIVAYHEAIELNPDYFWSNYNLGTAYVNQAKWDEAIAWYRRSVELDPGLNLPLYATRDTLLKQWNALFAQGDTLLKQNNRREAHEFYRKAIHAYRESMEIPKITIPKEIPLQPSILLIVDDYLPQCFRYRVQQKIEQLEYAGFAVNYFPMKEIDQAKNMLHFCHIVIFYRVPALPNVIETIEYAKAIKKVVFYEIDDLIFDEQNYPDSFESYGGQISIEQYEGLVRGTTLFREAMALCDYAIASTPALLEEMQNIVVKGTCFLHRNALDKLNFKAYNLRLSKVQRGYLSIFYGSGTKAHDADFSELVAPAIARILEKYSQTRLTLMGYISLPEVLRPYADRIDQIQLIEDVEIYWDFLRQADINIAVLNATRVNNCKSELKWFEAAYFKVPSVVSATQTYLEVIRHGIDGLIATTTEEWFTHLESLITDINLRTTIANTAYERVWQEYTLPVMANNIKNIISAGLQAAAADKTIVPKTSKKKLLIVNVFYPPQSIGGATRIVKDNVDVLRENYEHEYEISVFTSDNGNPNPYQVSEYSYQDMHITKISTPEAVGMDWKYQDEQIYDIFIQYLEFNKPDLIHFHCVQRLTASVLEAAFNQQIPYIVTVHDAWWICDHQFLVDAQGQECDHQQNDPLVVAKTTNNLGDSLRRQHYLRQQLSRAKTVLAVSGAFAKLYRENGFPQTQTNRNGIRLQPRLPRQHSTSGRIRLAHVGGVSAHKGYPLFKEAVEVAQLFNCEVIVVDHAQLIGSIRYEMWGNTPIKFISKIPQERMYEFYSTIDVLVAPSIWPESFGLITREAAAAGVWVVASNKGALAEDLISGTNGNVFSPDKIEELINILKKIDQEPEQYQCLVPKISHIRTTEEQIRELELIYQGCLSSKKE